MDTPMTSGEIVIVSWWAFTVWWLVFLAVHLITCGYNAMYTLFYWDLGKTNLCWYLVFYHVGMAPEHYRTIAAVHATMATVHGLCALLMVGCSLWYRTLTFTPWGGLSIVGKGAWQIKSDPELKMIEHTAKKRSSRINSMVRSGISKVAMQLTNRYGLLGVNGEYFHVFLVCRELVETTFQTIQTYRMSFLLPSMLLNRFYVVGLVLNCWSSSIIYALPFRSDEARKRFVCLACDCALDLMSCMGVTCIVVLSYVGQYSTDTTDFPVGTWYNDEWVARALNEFQMIVVVSWSDLFSRGIFSLGLVVTTTNLKELLYRSSGRGNCVAAAPKMKLIAPKQVKVKAAAKASGAPVANMTNQQTASKEKNTSRDAMKGRLRRAGHTLMHGVHVLFFIWGILVLGLHIQATVQPTLPQCVLQVRPWAVSRPSCFLLCLDCNRLDISGQLSEVDTNWHQFDGSTVAIMLIKHCPSLAVPDVFNEFHQLISIKIYNSTIVEWSDSAAITNTNHPAFLALMLARVNMTDGVLPAGFQSSDTPANLYDFEMCVTNIREVPDDLDSKWNLGSIVFIEFSELQTIPATLLRIMPTYLSLVGNPIVELPPETFEVEGMTDLAIGFTKIHELPQHVMQLSSTITTIYMHGTNVSYFWPWTDALVDPERERWMARPLMAGGSVYCDDLEKIANLSSTAFSAPTSSEYSIELMDPNKAGAGGIIWSWVDCSPAVSGVTGPLFALATDDECNALR